MKVGDLVQWDMDIGLITDTYGHEIRVQWLTPTLSNRLDEASPRCEYSWIWRGNVIVVSKT